MTLILENGSGVYNANSYIDAAYVTAYLTDRNRATENGWSGSGTEEDAACVEATDYIELRFRQSFKGAKEFRDTSAAKATLSIPSQPIAAEEVVVGATTYTFVAALVAANDVLIGASVSASIDNLVDAINANVNTAGTSFHIDTIKNVLGLAVTFYGNALVVFAVDPGTDGNSVIATTDVTGASWNSAGTLVGGWDVSRPQPLSFPKTGLFDPDGYRIVGIPEMLKMATAEYAVRARLDTTVLAPDPTTDALGGVIMRKTEKVGPIEDTTEYSEGTANNVSLPAYPAADRMLRDFLKSGGSVIRG